MKTVIAIDGPAASGKSSVAQRVANHLGFAYVNSGTFYRIMTWWVLEAGVDPEKPEDVVALLHEGKFVSGFIEGHAFFYVDGKDGEAFTRDESINRYVSPVARVPEVREIVTNHLRGLAKTHDLVMEGRDIGTAVFPETPYKLYIDADPAVREQRRAAQGQKDQIVQRDKIDSSRTVAPLTVASDATVIDSTHLSIDAVAAAALEQLKSRGLPALAA